MGCDPLLDNIEIEFRIKALNNLENLTRIAALVLTVVHRDFEKINLEALKRIMSHNPVLIDVRAFYHHGQVERLGFYH